MIVNILIVFRKQILEGTDKRTKEYDDLGFAHERYEQYYKGIKIEPADIRTHYLNDLLVCVNGEYIDIQKFIFTIKPRNLWLKNSLECYFANRVYPKTL